MEQRHLCSRSREALCRDCERLIDGQARGIGSDGPKMPNPSTSPDCTHCADDLISSKILGIHSPTGYEGQLQQSRPTGRLGSRFFVEAMDLGQTRVRRPIRNSWKHSNQA